MATDLHGWHPGEQAIQQKLGYASAVQGAWRLAENTMREQHRIFHTSNIPFVPVTTMTNNSRVWASILTAPDGKIGFIKSPDDKTLVVTAGLWDGEPMLDTLKNLQDPVMKQRAREHRFLTAGVGIEYSTRRRNKFAGEITGAKHNGGGEWEMTITVNEAMGNCPKYINVRDLVPAPANPEVIYRKHFMKGDDRLPQDAIDFITSSDTVYIASLYRSSPETAATYPSHAGMNSRGGLPGFVRVMPSDGRTLVVPDYSGNRFLMSLGNIEANESAGMTFVCFKTGDVLYLTGNAKVLVGQEAQDIMPRQACVVTMQTTGYTFVKDAMPVRQRPGTQVEPSPYSPKIKYLADEPQAVAASASGRKARVVAATQLEHDLAVFRFAVDNSKNASAEPLRIRPGQAVVLDFMDWVGPPTYRHMANDAPGSINDDRVRTWTVSSAHEAEDASWFEMTMREMPSGAVTGKLFDTLRAHPDNKAFGQQVTFAEDIASDVVGVTGDFFLGDDPVNVLWVAGGIGLTPFLSMLAGLGDRGEDASGDVVLALAARDADPLLNLTRRALDKVSSKVKVRIDLFTSQEEVDISAIEGRDGVSVSVRKGRIPKDYWSVAGDRDVFICGPGGFGDAAEDGLRKAGVDNGKIHREGFY